MRVQIHSTFSPHRTLLGHGHATTHVPTSKKQTVRLRDMQYAPWMTVDALIRERVPVSVRSSLGKGRTRIRNRFVLVFPQNFSNVGGSFQRMCHANVISLKTQDETANVPK